MVRGLPFSGGPGAIDGARYVRVPGSFRTDQEEYVHWDLKSYGDRPRSHTLKELAEFFAIPLERRLPQELDATLEAAGRCPARSKGWKATNRNRLAAFLILKDLRAGGFDGGCRNCAAFLYARSLKANGEARTVALQSVKDMAALCRPALSLSECEAAIKSSWKQRSFKLSYHRMADMLKVSPREAEVISRAIQRPFPAAANFAVRHSAANTVPERTRAESQADRRLKIRLIAENLEQPPSFREMKALLFQRGTHASHVTIRADYKALGLVSCQSAIRRATAAVSRNQLSLS